MTAEQLIVNIKAASGLEKPELVIKNCRIVNVFTHEIIEGDIAICGGKIIGIGRYDGIENRDAQGRYALPGLIESHIHVESSFITPEEFARAIVPHGTTTAIADPHEIVNVCGMDGLDYMIRAAGRSACDIKYMMPSCVPCVGWDHNGAVIDAEALAEGLDREGVLGVGEFMNAYGILGGDQDCIDKLIAAHRKGTVIDGHAPGLSGSGLRGYAVSGIGTDHECETVEEMQERLRNGMYVMLRYGSAAQNLPELLTGLTEGNSRRCLLCSDDRNAEDMIDKGDIDELLRICVSLGTDPITAVQMATINAAECYGLNDRGAIAPGRRADIVLVDDLKSFRVTDVYAEGRLTAQDGRYITEIIREDISPAAGRMLVKDFSEERLKMHLKSGRVHIIGIRPGSLLTDDITDEVMTDDEGEPVLDSDTARISVIERHKGTGNIASAMIRGYGIQTGAIAISMAHDSHNIITVGKNTSDMYRAVERLIETGGGIVLADKGEILESLALPVAGLMSTMTAEQTADAFRRIHRCAYERLGVSRDLEPVIALSFMALPVIPELKLTDTGLYSVSRQELIKA